MTLFARVVELLKERDAGDIVVFGGGIIPDADIPELERLGVAKVFTPGRHDGDRRLGARERLHRLIGRSWMCDASHPPSRRHRRPWAH